VIADPVNPRRFYGLALFDGQLFVSTMARRILPRNPSPLPDGLPTRGGDRGDNRGGQTALRHAREGRRPVAGCIQRSVPPTDGGVTFSRLGHVGQIHAFGFGKAAPGASYPALYLIGVVDDSVAFSVPPTPPRAGCGSTTTIINGVCCCRLRATPSSSAGSTSDRTGGERFTATRRQRRPAEPRQEITG